MDQPVANGDDALAIDLPRQRDHRATAATPDSRIADPADPRRIFSWLICETYDDRGNVIVYDVQARGRRPASTCAAPHERNRTPLIAAGATAT